MVLVSLFVGGLQSSHCFVLGRISPSAFNLVVSIRWKYISLVKFFRDHASHRAGGLFGIHGAMHDPGKIRSTAYQDVGYCAPGRYN